MATRKKPTSQARITIRLTDDEQSKLLAEAAGQSISAYARQCLFGGSAKRSKLRMPHVNEVLLAQVLAKLGQSRLSSNLNQLAKAVHLAKRPDDLHRLEWRQFETLLFRIFQNQGFTSELGPGSGDGGIDIRLLQRDPLGDILTLVQVKRYASHRKINQSAVAALHGVADVEKAQRSIFVTTSDYLPSARAFAERTTIPMDLATSYDVRDWCRAASNGIIQDKSKLVTPSAVSALLYSLSEKDPRIVHAHTGYSMITNQFAIVLKETNHAALLMSIPARKISDDGYGQMGFEVPDIGPRCLERLTAANVFRTTRSASYGRISYWTGNNLYSAWDGQPAHFNYCD